MHYSDFAIDLPGPMRIATSGGKLHGKDMVAVMESFDTIIQILNKER